MRSFAVMLLLAPALARADAKSDAQKHIDQATRSFEAGKSEDAIAHLKEAYALDPQPEILYAFGQAHASLGQCDKAKTFFDRYAEAKPEDAQVARDAAAACKEAPPVVTPPPVDVKPAPPPPPPTPMSRPWHADTLGLAVAGIGLALTGIGTFGLISSNAIRDDATSAPTYDEFLSKLDKADSKRTLSIGILAGGSAAVIGGIVHVVLRARAEPAIRVTTSRDGAAVSFVGRF